MVARGLSCLLAGMMMGGVSQTSAFNVDSLPQVTDLTTFSVTSLNNDVNCPSTSMDVVSKDKYIQVCGRTATGPGVSSRVKQPSLGNNEGENAMRKAPSALRKTVQTGEPEVTTTTTPATTSSTEAPPSTEDPPSVVPNAESYFQLMNKTEFGMEKKVTAADGSTIFKSVTSYENNTILVSTEGSTSLVAYDATTLAVATVTLPTTAAPSSRTTTKISLDIAPRSIAWDKANQKLYATDGTTNKIYVFSSTFQREKTIDLVCGKEGINTTNLGDIVYVKPYLYVAIEASSYLIRVDIPNSKCDSTWLVDFSTYKDESFKEADKLITSFSMDTFTPEYTGTGFPKMMIAGKNWNHIYELSNASSYIVNSFIIFAITAITSIFSS